MPIAPGGIKNMAIESRTDVKISLGSLVDYEQHNKLIIAIVTRERKSNWVVINAEGKEVELSSVRLFSYPSSNYKGDISRASARELADYLTNISHQAENVVSQICLQDIWDVVSAEPKEYSLRELAELALSEIGAVGLVALRKILIADGIFFKRKKLGFEPRQPEIVEELKKVAAAEERKIQEKKTLIDTICRVLRGEKLDLPPSHDIIVDLAVNGGKSPRYKEASVLIGEIVDIVSNASWGDKFASVLRYGRSEERAFELLVFLGVFSKDEHITLHRMGIHQSFSDEIYSTVKNITSIDLEDPTKQLLKGRQDLTHLFLISIDAEDTLDIDDALSIVPQSGGFQVGVHISDISSLVEPNSILDLEARHRAISLYFPDRKIPMFPVELSEGVASLWAGKLRLTISYLIDVDREGRVLSRNIVPSFVRVAKRLSYNFVDELLEKQDGVDEESRYLLAQLSSLWSVASMLEKSRLSRGAVSISRREVFPVVDANGYIRLEEWQEDTPSRKLVSELMVLANETGAIFAAEKGIPLVFRLQEGLEDKNIEAEQTLQVKEQNSEVAVPRVGLRPSTVSSVPGPHAGLAVRAYAQLTSPIRRYHDLINERQLITALTSEGQLLTKGEIDDLIMHLDNTMAESRILQRERTRYWLLKYLIQEKIKLLSGTIVRIDGPKPLAEIDLFGVNFLFRSSRHKLGNTSLKVGERVNLSVERVEPRNDDLVLVDRR